MRLEQLDRRRPGQGDRRREALLQAMDELLREKDFPEIAVGEVTQRAGVTRSAFYFYFESTAACVAALGAAIYVDAIAATGHLSDHTLPPARRLTMLMDELLASIVEHHYLYRATLEAARRSPAIRELWDGYLESFVTPVAAFVRAERRAGAAPAGPDATLLARLLLDLSDRALESVDAGDPAGTRRTADALATVWLRTVYGTTDQIRRRPPTA
ncbi:TetR/AcrR family transcriptional regulator [Spongisporangium articulatum]|uniref:TetR/AcrR family transcriptional regulator n=1 Tax=Spongisporangium articulatum TaxID=3362603 RepID=A0ABW8ATK5_9ACTN